MARQITIDIVGDASKFTKATQAADNGLRDTAIGGAIAGASMAVVSKALDFVTDSFSNASEAAKEDTKSQDLLALAYKNTGTAQKLSIAQIEEVISANQKKGVSDSEQRAGISNFLDLTNDATAAMELNNATIELAAAKGIAYSEAEAMIRSAAAGRAAALNKAGVETEKGASITEIATAVNEKFGGSLDAVAETQSGKSAIANEKMGEAMERVGRVINDIATVVMPILLGAFADVVDFLMDNVIPVISDIAKVVLPILRKAFEIIAPIVKDVFRIVADVVRKAFDIIVPIIKALMPVFKTVFNVIGDVVKALQPVFSTVFKVIGTIIDTAVRVIKTAFGAIKVAIDVLSKVFTGIQTVVTRVWDSISGAIKGGVNFLIGIINGLIRAINSIQIHIGRVGLDVPGVGFVGVGPFDWNGLNLGYLPRLHQGGIVPGVAGSDVLALLQAGERVIPRNQVNSGGNITIVFNGPVYGDDMENLARRVAMRLRTVGG